MKVPCVLFSTVFFVPSVRQWDGILGPALRAGTLRAAPGAHAVSLGRRVRDGPTLCAVTSAVTAVTPTCRRLWGTLPPRPPPARAHFGLRGGRAAGPGPGRGRDRPAEGLTRALGSARQSVNSPWAKQVYAGPRGPAGGLALGSCARTTAYASCAGVLCGPCVAPCLPLGPVSSTARDRSSRGTATVHRSRPSGAAAQ